MKRDKQNSRENPGYSGRIDVNAFYALEQLALQNKSLDNQRAEIMADKAMMAGKAVAGGAYEVLVKAPARGLYNLTALAGSVGVGLAGVVANTALGVGRAVMDSYIALANSGESNNDAYSAGMNDAFRSVFGRSASHVDIDATVVS